MNLKNLKWQFMFNLKARFHSMHVATCSSFAIDLTSDSPHPSTCLKGHPTSDPENEDDIIEFDDVEEKVTSSKLDPRGYR